MSQPCPGNNTCCNRPEFDRTMFPCTPERQIASLRARLAKAEAGAAAMRDALEELTSFMRRDEFIKQAMIAHAHGFPPPSDDFKAHQDRAWSKAGNAIGNTAGQPLLEELERTRNERDHLRLQAESWAQEARAQRATVNECYQAVTGATGEPGDWHGAKPVVDAIASLREQVGRLRKLAAKLDVGVLVHCLEEETRRNPGPWAQPMIAALYEVEAAATENKT